MIEVLLTVMGAVFIVVVLLAVYWRALGWIYSPLDKWDYERAERYLIMYSAGENVPDFGFDAIRRIPHLKDFPTIPHLKDFPTERDKQFRQQVLDWKAEREKMLADFGA